MVVQMNPAAPQLLLLVTAPTVVAGSIWVAIRAMRGRRYRPQLAVLVAVIALYVGAWLGFGVRSVPVMLARGDIKCFDDWCATFRGARAVSTRSIEVAVRLSNSGGNPQKSNLARAFIVADKARLWPREPDAVQQTVPGNGSVDVTLTFDVPPAAQKAQFVISESDSGSFTPALLVIDDEASPFHARTAWSLTP